MSNPQEAQRLLERQGWPVERKAEKLLVPCGDKRKAAMLVEALVLGKHAVYQVMPKTKSLEDIFIELTGKGQSL